MSSLAENKKNLRRKILEARASIQKEEWEGKSAQIVDFLLKSDLYYNSENIHCYVSMNERNEVNTHDLIQQMIRDGKKVYVPVTNFNNGTLSHVALKSFEDLKPNKWGVPEPVAGKPVLNPDFDLIIVPMTAADLKGNRLGYGKGFYDRFLSAYEAVKAGLIFEEFLVEKIPVEDFDINMDVLISEKGLIFT